VDLLVPRSAAIWVEERFGARRTELEARAAERFAASAEANPRDEPGVAAGNAEEQSSAGSGAGE
jgi:hypothetical protein